jgi:hypothetical protein
VLTAQSFSCVKEIPAMYCCCIRTLCTGVQPPSYLVDALLLRASRLMAEFSGSEMSDMVAALARLQYRPSDAWLKLFTQQVSCLLLCDLLPGLQTGEYTAVPSRPSTNLNT